MRTFVALALGIAMIAASGSALADGEKSFKKRCGACHTVEAGKHRTGPSLHGISGKKAGGTDFPRYKGLKGADITWDDATMDAWITDSKAFAKAKLPGGNTTMIVKVSDAAERKEIIEYLKKN